MISKTYNRDCVEAMKEYPDNHFDLAVVDPPYGIGVNKMTLGNGKNKIYRGELDWDKEPPNKAFFYELVRVSKNQVIWGANHFIENIPNANSSCWFFWDKGTGNNDFADGELAYTSFKTTVRKFFKSWVGANAKDGHKRIHPTQKPIALYDWIFQNYAKEGDLILDTHLGSQSSRIAAHKNNLDFIGYEIDADYFNEGNKRYELFASQLTLF